MFNTLQWYVSFVQKLIAVRMTLLQAIRRNSVVVHGELMFI